MMNISTYLTPMSMPNKGKGIDGDSRRPESEPVTVGAVEGALALKAPPLAFFDPTKAEENESMLKKFLAAKRIEGCTANTLYYYDVILRPMLKRVNKSVLEITTDDLRNYLSNVQAEKNLSMTTLNNERRVFRSFFGWMEEEEYINRSPVRRIHNIRAEKVVKEAISDEAMERLRDNCKNPRDLAIIDLLASTGMRVGELIQLNRDNINFQEREIIVYGKGKKERVVYFDAKAKLHLQAYLDSRTDDNPALFVSLQYPYERFLHGGILNMLHGYGKALGLKKIHPHKFRRTMATKAIDKGMPIEQVRELLGHVNIATTTEYALVSRSNVKHSHKKYIG